jgi:hypothetical protein
MTNFRALLRSGCGGVALTAALLLLPAQAAVLYGTTAIGSSPRTSDYGSNTQAGWRSFENFQIAGGGSVQRITWSGLWFGDLQPAPAPAPDALSWDIAFHASAGAAPGAQLALQNYLTAQVSSSYLGAGVLNAGGLYNVSFYEYSVELSNAFVAQDGIEYWLSIMARSDDLSPAFAWRGATGGDDASYQQLLGAGMTVTGEFARAADRHVVLEGERLNQTVPEPASGLLVLLAIGAMGLIGRPRAAAQER